MNFQAAFKDFFQSPKWTTNLLMAAVCMLIPIIGPIVVLGWLITGFWARTDESPLTFPDFDFGKFGKYLDRGLMPFVITFVGAIGLGLAVAIVFGIVGFIVGFILAKILPFLVALLAFVLYLAAILVMMVGLKPIFIKAILTQDFAQSFDFGFIKAYATKMWKEMVISAAVLLVAGMVLGVAGIIACGVGIYAAAVINMFAHVHVDKQIYNMYLARGGQAIVPSPKLSIPI